MEEILASIRRIIEDSDTARPANDAPVSDVSAPPVAAAGKGTDFEAVRLGVRDFAGQADRSDRSRESSQQSVDLPRDRQIAEELRPSLSAVSAHQPVASASTAVNEPTAVSPQPEADAVQVPAKEDPILAFEDLLDEELTAAPLPEPAPASPMPSIISDRAGKQVAAAFGELSEAFAATRQKSFDEMAEAMLRPMLTDWLDNNLPTLVERLVREEIERIARGPAR